MSNKSVSKKIELALVLFLIVFAFFAGVSYSDAVKDHASWLFEPKEEEVELPDLSNESPAENVPVVDENGENISRPEAAPQNNAPVNNEVQPGDRVQP